MLPSHPILTGEPEGARGKATAAPAREEGSFSYRNAMIIEHDGQCAGCLIGL
jgi:hypothetical protein